MRTRLIERIERRVRQTCCLAIVCVISGLLISCGAHEQLEEREPQPNKSSAVHDTMGPDLTHRWSAIREPRQGTEPDPDQQDQFARLQTLGYVAGSRKPQTDKTVTVHVPDKVYAGLNFYVSAHAPEALLIDMEGKQLHRWTYSFAQAWPDVNPEQIASSCKDYWRRAYLFENGDIIAIFEGFGIVKIDKDSKLIWARSNGAHHDLQLMPDGEIYALTRKTHLVPRMLAKKPVREDYICVLDAEGNEKKRLSLLPCVEDLYSERGMTLPVADHGDILHTNSIEVLDGRASHVSEALAAGNVLVSMRTISLVGIVNLRKEKFVAALWSAKPIPPAADGTPRLFFRYQHDPTILSDGNMLLFDNNGLEGRSTIWEFHPVTGDVHWTYRGTDAEPFYSAVCGVVQRLPNGNTLITESDNGRVFEVTAAKEIVWEFYNPHRAGDEKQYIALVPELLRLPPSFPVDWMRKAEH